MEQMMELLAPAGSPEILKAVINAGADAVYLGGDQFGARAYANNFSKQELLEALDYAHLRGKKIYLTVNTLLKNSEIDSLYEYLLPFYKKGLDAVLVQDLGALIKIHEWFPDMQIHTSTQMTVTGVEGVRFLQQYGVSRVVMAREVSIQEMKKIHEETGMELEAFVHGALCYSYSGQCLFSSLLGGRSGNRGRCAQPCRLAYAVLDHEKQVIKNESYILSLKDFCCVRSIQEMKDAGIFSLKIEGRMKQLSYAAGVVSAYRKYVDMATSMDDFHVLDNDMKHIEELGNRCGFTDGYLYKHNGSDMVTFDKPSFVSDAIYEEADKCYHFIQGELIIQKDSPMKLHIWDDNYEINVMGPAPEIAQKQPMLLDDVDKRIRKTKDTAFLFASLKITLDDGLFVPNGILNQLKRDAIVALEQKILEGYERETKKQTFSMQVQQEQKIDGNSLSLENRDLLDLLLGYESVTNIYLDSSMYMKDNFLKDFQTDVKKIKASGKKAYYILPVIFRNKTRVFYESMVDEFHKLNFEGFVVKNLESLFFAQHYFKNFKIISDHNLYAYNDYASNMLINCGISAVTVPLELNRKEILNRDNSNSQMIVYGYYPLMTSAQCVCKNATGCKQKPRVLYLKDRYNKEFPVRNCCAECYNIIYNSLPTKLFFAMEELEKAGVASFRLHFSVESKEQTQEIMNEFESYWKNQSYSNLNDKKDSFTNGHYKRGVE